MQTQHILVIDDEESIRYTLGAFLTAEGYHVATAGDFAEALQQVESRRFDLILADILLGARTGLDVLRELRRREIGTPLVLITGSPELGTATEALRLGACDYLAKPITREVVLSVTRNALSNNRARVEQEQLRCHIEAVFASVDEGIVTVDAAARLLTINPAAAHLCALKQAVVGQPLAVSGGEGARLCSALFEEVLVHGRSAGRESLRLVDSSGTTRQLSLRASPLPARGGGCLGAVLLVHDESGREGSQVLPPRERAGCGRLVGRSPRMQEVYGLVEVLAAVDSTVLITGESGTGKELVAEALHRAGTRRNRPLVRVNCAALAENLLESELFGHVRGAFTGAATDVVGRFQKAHGGTIFLDEIGDIPAALQVRLLRVLQEKEIERVGDATPIPVDVRILAATHQDLLKKVRRGEFREDLYYRLKVVNVDLPPLRSRKEDLPQLLEHFRLQFNQRFSRSVRGFADAVYYTLVRHDWPGNVRELEHAVEHAFVLCRGDLIDLEHLPAELRQSAPVPRQVDRDTAAQAEHLRGALARAGGNKAKAARLLGMSRQTLYRKLSDLGLEETPEDAG